MRGGTFFLLLVQRLPAFFLLQPAVTATAEKVVLHEIQAAHQQFHPKSHELESPFLSSTLRTRLSPVAAAIDAHQLGLLSAALVTFYQRVFEEQQTYDVEVVGVAIFEEALVAIAKEEDGNRRALWTGEGGERRLALNELQNKQFHFQSEGKEDYYYENGVRNSVSSSESFDDAQYNGERKEDRSVGDGGGTGGYTLTFATVVSAEHTEHQYLSHADFQRMLVHVSHKFDSHMVEYVRRIGDGYFGSVERVAVSGYEQESSSDAVGASENPGAEAEDRREWKLNRLGPEAGIVILCILVLAAALFAVASVKMYRKGRQLTADKRWRAQEIATSNSAPPGSSIKALQVLYRKPSDDDYSFDPVCTNNGYNGKSTVGRDSGTESHDRQSTLLVEELDDCREETIFFESPTSLLFTQSPSVVETLPETPVYYHNSRGIPPPCVTPTPQRQREVLPQHVFAPPGRVGVAIDVVDGHPVVHRVKRGSPLDGLLRPNDRVLAIDHVDTTCMSAADVTQLMAKRMNFNRRITFVRGAGDS